MPVALTVNWH